LLLGRACPALGSAHYLQNDCHEPDHGKTVINAGEGLVRFY
jgi:hypothetical protein